MALWRLDCWLLPGVMISQTLELFSCSSFAGGRPYVNFPR